MISAIKLCTFGAHERPCVNAYKFHTSNGAKKNAQKNVSYLPKQRKTSYLNSMFYRLCATVLAQTFSKPYLEIMLPKLERGPTCSALLQNPTIVAKLQHVISPKNSHDIFLHTYALDSDLNRIYTLLHPSSQTHNYSLWSYYTLLWGSYVYDPRNYYCLLKWRNYPPPYFTYNHVRDIFPML